MPKTFFTKLRAFARRISLLRFITSLALGGLVLYLINTFDSVEHSFVGAPDRAMQDTAFWLRSDDFAGKADPYLFVDIDNDTVGLSQYRTSTPPFAPSVYVSRSLLADLLRFVLETPADQAPKVVVLDADIGGPAPDPAGPAKLRAVLEDWAKTPGAPPLYLARETFEPAPLGETGALRLPATLYDDIVDASPKIDWGTPKVLYDDDGFVGEFSPYECVERDGRITPLFSIAIEAYRVLNGGKLPPGSPVEEAVLGAQAHCDSLEKNHLGELQTPRRPAYGIDINLHLTMRAPEQGRSWPRLHDDWDGAAACGEQSRPTILRQISATVMAEAGEDASRDILCRRVVFIGGTNQIANDVAATPVGSMPGALVLINATRGLQIDHGGLKPAHWSIQLTILVVVTFIMFVVSGVIEDIRERYQNRTKDNLRRRILMLPLNPVFFSGVMWTVVSGLEVALLLWSMSFGYWGFLSGPAMGSAIGNLLGDFIDEERD